MANEDYIVRFYFDIRNADRDAAKMANRLATISAAMRALGQDTKYIDQAALAMSKMAGATKTLTSSGGGIGGTGSTSMLSQLRSVGYEALVVGGIFNRLGASILGGLNSVVGASIEYERVFANVVRTTNDGTITMSYLRKELIDLSSQIPVTFGDLSKIATLGGQLGIAGSGIDEFTSVVARLTATTNLTADVAGTALGRFQALLGVPASEFENIASAILKVGINSVATETQIVSISTQISAMAAFAGFTAEQVVGLAGALASVGAAPELSRGTITRTFAQMSKAIAQGGAKLDEFARISGVTSAVFASSFGTSKFAPIFENFLSNLGELKKSGENAVLTLNDLGVTSVRDVPLLLRLAGATGTVKRAFDDARTGFTEGSELQKQYAIIAGTTSAKIQLLTNNITNFLSSIGDSATGPVAVFVDVLSEIVKGLKSFTDTDFGKAVSLEVLYLTALLGVVLTLGGAVAFGAGTFLLLANALDRLSVAGVVSASTMTTLSGGLTLAGRAAGFLAVSLKAIPFVAIVAAFAGIADAAHNIANEKYGFDNLDASFATLVGNSDKLIDRINQSGDAFAGFVNAADGSIFTIDEFRLAIVATDKALATLARNGQAEAVIDRISTLMITTGKSFDEVLTAFNETRTALEEVAAAAGMNANAFLDAAQAEAEFAVLQEKLASTLGLTSDEFKTLSDSLNAASDDFFSISDIVGTVQDNMKVWAEGQSVAATGSKDSWQDWYDSVSFNLTAFNDILANQIIANANWADNVGILIGRGLDAGVIQEISDAGDAGKVLAQALVDNVNGEFDRFADLAPKAWGTGMTGITDTLLNNVPLLEAAAAAGGDAAVVAMIDALDGGKAEIDKVIDDYNIQLANDPLRIYAKTEDAQNEVNQFLNRVAAAHANVSIGTTVGSYGNVTRFAASGGYISGRGTGTSDSIPARLSNGEYVIRAASVRQYGAGIFDQLNRGVAKFASGGPVGFAGGKTNNIGAQHVTNVSVVQNNPLTKDPLKQLRESSEMLSAGIWR